MTHYQTLRVPPCADADTIRRSWLRLAMQYHPDRNPSGAAKMAAINEAYTVLADPATRKAYDFKISTLKFVCVRCSGTGQRSVKVFGKKSIISNPCTHCAGSGWR